MLNAASLNIAILCITDRPAKDIGPRTVELVDRVLRSAHRFSGLSQILPDADSVNGTLQRWIDDADGVDIILVIDESAADLQFVPPKITFGFIAAANAPFAELIHDRALGFVGIVDLRAALCGASSI